MKTFLLWVHRALLSIALISLMIACIAKQNTGLNSTRIWFAIWAISMGANAALLYAIGQPEEDTKTSVAVPVLLTMSVGFASMLLILACLNELVSPK